jgi:hypothetical protein
MAANVFANGKEMSGKASPHKVLGSMPDVCLSPPPPPAGPVPIPYPNFAQSSDLANGSKTVKIGGKEVTLKDKSSYKKSKGDEAATRNFGGGLISHNISGPVKNKAGSFDIKVESSSVVRFMDLTTGNHSNPGDGCATINTAKTGPSVAKSECEKLKENNDAKREEFRQRDQLSTVTSATVDRRSSWSCSRDLGTKFKNGYSGGLDRYWTRRKTGANVRVSDVKDKKGRRGKKASNLCPAARKKFKYKTTDSTSRPHTSHTEARIIESAFAGGTPKRIVMAINWQRLVGDKIKVYDNPCGECKALICAATACGVEILMCDKNNKPRDVESKTGMPCKS